MNKVGMLQILVIFSMIGMIYSVIRENNLFRDVSQGNLYEKVVRLNLVDMAAGKSKTKFLQKRNRVAEEKILLSQGSYYFGNSFIKSFVYPNYIYIRQCHVKQSFQLFLKTDWEGIDVSVLKGKIETSSGILEKDSYQVIHIQKNQFFMIGNLRVNVD